MFCLAETVLCSVHWTQSGLPSRSWLLAMLRKVRSCCSEQSCDAIIYICFLCCSFCLLLKEYIEIHLLSHYCDSQEHPHVDMFLTTNKSSYKSKGNCETKQISVWNHPIAGMILLKTNLHGIARNLVRATMLHMYHKYKPNMYYVNNRWCGLKMCKLYFKRLLLMKANLIHYQFADLFM